MDRFSHETLLKVEKNNATLIGLRIGDHTDFFDGSDFCRLGKAIGKNTRLQQFEARLDRVENILHVSDTAFYDGLKRNTSIRELYLDCSNHNIVGGVGEEILKAYQQNHRHLTSLRIYDAELEHGGCEMIVATLRCCTNLVRIELHNCNITDEQLLPIMEAIRGHRSLESLCLDGHNIGNPGCDVVTTFMLENPSTNLHTLSLTNNSIDTICATTILNSLAHNNKLESLYLGGNQFDQPIVRGALSKLLCDTSSINKTYLSNHTLDHIGGIDLAGDNPARDRELRSLLQMNRTKYKSYVAIRKVLKYHPMTDMEPFFEWLEEGDQNLKALPYVIGWFNRAEIAASSDNPMGTRKLSAVFQFALAMPLLLEGISSLPNKDDEIKVLEG